MKNITKTVVTGIREKRMGRVMSRGLWLVSHFHRTPPSAGFLLIFEIRRIVS